MVEVARRWLLQKKPERALEILEVGAKQRGASAMLDVLLGTSYAAVGKTNQAEQASRRATVKAPKLLAGYQNLYSTQFSAGRTNEAREELTAVLANEVQFGSLAEAKELMRTLK